MTLSKRLFRMSCICFCFSHAMYISWEMHVKKKKKHLSTSFFCSFPFQVESILLRWWRFLFWSAAHFTVFPWCRPIPVRRLSCFRLPTLGNKPNTNTTTHSQKRKFDQDYTWAEHISAHRWIRWQHGTTTQHISSPSASSEGACTISNSY